MRGPRDTGGGGSAAGDAGGEGGESEGGGEGPFISEALHAFMVACFEVEPTRRPTAEALLEHAFLRDGAGRARDGARDGAQSAAAARAGEDADGDQDGRGAAQRRRDTADEDRRPRIEKVHSCMIGHGPTQCTLEGRGKGALARGIRK